MSEPIKRFVVSRATWGRGETGGNLLSKMGLRCCLGFVCSQIGMSDEQLRGWGQPADADKAGEYTVGVLTERRDDGLLLDTDLSRAAMSINDDEGMSDSQRERALAELFAKHGYTLEFKP